MLLSSYCDVLSCSMSQIALNIGNYLEFNSVFISEHVTFITPQSGESEFESSVNARVLNHVFSAFFTSLCRYNNTCYR